ncbi:MAG: D-isomer specific 2-hydroxyacid dehydrogenase NAD-binding protein [Candidatus Nomurabacteria bacterium GW2011_GWE1_32_28]|uniref:D-isomer specific 2-hydroxyacid dehydrogenase NAD-binding protein n=1 Tax=Candidatus Nomurabacteria bacterium GW2011_GWF1_31_48 TaxID=1618767 RepID=A0A0F9YGB7_9BACT|nr:MAG: D-isomer specific 2-hydroxyacid dehydrogenase NAD-binding protein [Candidatus Nomurabacteria bacterium GW2011_GWF2_30_133]KKP29102.1 MAG: D-isomer specific 2-hydroxyacid dehydrogenase NAD-binding protein [Candidatus Nomurabacteria bacterium GW2011_GWE2_31_40]KKP30488.1 MAG: D-isomer specific 2-hydroxyacid dehydrogenase NAD-binding protein [Candidatus Nomurabacteria bacterium GW2011_GWF1_31_48]KKP34973.1 MAG: D-isomer specific 2-hydroxyacid dehydrogenase NAD-binding protein [Candidatus No
MKIAFFEVSKTRQDFLREFFNGEDVSFFEEKLNESNVDLVKDVDVVSVFVDSDLNKNVIEKIPNLKFIATQSTGFNHIDCEYAFSKGIKVSNVPAYGSHTVAEFAFGLILNLSRNIYSANAYLRETLDYNYFPWMEGFNLEGKTIGVIGTGKIGKNVVKIAKGFEMNVLAYDLYPDIDFAKENNFEYKDFDEVLSKSDIITLHAPYTEENHHLIKKENILKMKKGVYLINTARGELVETEALVWGLEEKIIAGAGLDVLEGVKQLKDDKNMTILNHKLMKMPNVIVSPHMAFFTREAVLSIMQTTVDNIKGFLSDNLQNLVK